MDREHVRWSPMTSSEQSTCPTTCPCTAEIGRAKRADPQGGLLKMTEHPLLRGEEGMRLLRRSDLGLRAGRVGGWLAGSG